MDRRDIVVDDLVHQRIVVGGFAPLEARDLFVEGVRESFLFDVDAKGHGGSFPNMEVYAMKSSMQHQFSQVPRADIPRSSFDRSNNYKTTFDAGYLIPIFVDDVLPGDTFNCNMTAFGRLATPLHPFMDNMWLDTFFFFVPYRLVWSNCTAGPF